MQAEARCARRGVGAADKHLVEKPGHARLGRLLITRHRLPARQSSTAEGRGTLSPASDRDAIEALLRESRGVRNEHSLSIPGNRYSLIVADVSRSKSVSPSDCGKRCATGSLGLQRACRWKCDQQPGGGAFPHPGADAPSVRAQQKRPARPPTWLVSMEVNPMPRGPCSPAPRIDAWCRAQAVGALAVLNTSESFHLCSNPRGAAGQLLRWRVAERGA